MGACGTSFRVRRSRAHVSQTRFRGRAQGHRTAVTAVELAAAQRSLDALRAAAAGCRACHLWEHATQTVFGEGTRHAEVMFVGEQPGDKEDLAGHPFVGPAGRVLDEALEEVGIDREHVYVTNAVKHFKWKARGKRRIHDKPNAAEIAACRPWLDAELAAVRPTVVVPLGATAAQALLGRAFRVTAQRGAVLETTKIAPFVVATVHPSSILRAPDRAARRAAQRDFTADLAVVAELLH
ncbi:MAG: UdgX family uracil-DNA binding protein [Actinobacteria bacterium]|nr:UdgX family uracil-DNA binding protein [Actinomycetota bacterium]